MSDKPHSRSLQSNYIERDATNIVKGVALVFMFIHHFFTIPSFYIDTVSYPQLERFADVFSVPFKICVAVFAFLTGYFYVYSNKKFSYSLRKGTDLWVSFFVFYLVLLIPAVALGCWEGSVSNFILEAIGIRRPVMVFCWYVVFYIISILLLPLFHKASKKHALIPFVLGLLLPIGISAALSGLVQIPNEYIHKTVFDFLTWFPCIAVGYIVARYDLYKKLFDRLFKFPVRFKAVEIIVDLILVLTAFMGRYYLPQVAINISIFTISIPMDIIYVPVFVYGLLNLIYAVPWKKLFLPLSKIGKYSMGMWFFHCVFFNVCKQYTQPILFFPKNPILVLLWGLLICFIASFALTKAISPILKLKNRIQIFK